MKWLSDLRQLWRDLVRRVRKRNREEREARERAQFWDDVRSGEEEAEASASKPRERS